MTNATPSATSNPAGVPTVTRQVTFTLRAFDHMKQTQRKLKAEEGINLNNNQVLERIFDQHAQQFPAVGHVSTTKGANHAQ